MKKIPSRVSYEVHTISWMSKSIILGRKKIHEFDVIVFFLFHFAWHPTHNSLSFGKNKMLPTVVDKFIY